MISIVNDGQVSMIPMSPGVMSEFLGSVQSTEWIASKVFLALFEKEKTRSRNFEGRYTVKKGLSESLTASLANIYDSGDCGSEETISFAVLKNNDGQGGVVLYQEAGGVWRHVVSNKEFDANALYFLLKINFKSDMDSCAGIQGICELIQDQFAVLSNRKSDQVSCAENITIIGEQDLDPFDQSQDIKSDGFDNVQKMLSKVIFSSLLPDGRECYEAYSNVSSDLKHRLGPLLNDNGDVIIKFAFSVKDSSQCLYQTKNGVWECVTNYKLFNLNDEYNLITVHFKGSVQSGLSDNELVRRIDNDVVLAVSTFNMDVDYILNGNELKASILNIIYSKMYTTTNAAQSCFDDMSNGYASIVNKGYCLNKGALDRSFWNQTFHRSDLRINKCIKFAVSFDDDAVLYMTDCGDWRSITKNQNIDPSKEYHIVTLDFCSEPFRFLSTKASYDLRKKEQRPALLKIAGKSICDVMKKNNLYKEKNGESNDFLSPCISCKNLKISDEGNQLLIAVYNESYFVQKMIAENSIDEVLLQGLVKGEALSEKISKNLQSYINGSLNKEMIFALSEQDGHILYSQDGIWRSIFKEQALFNPDQNYECIRVFFVQGKLEMWRKVQCLVQEAKNEASDTLKQEHKNTYRLEQERKRCESEKDEQRKYIKSLFIRASVVCGFALVCKLLQSFDIFSLQMFFPTYWMV